MDYKILSSNDNSFSYLATISKTPYIIKISTNGELIDIKPYQDNKCKTTITSNKNRSIELG